MERDVELPKVPMILSSADELNQTVFGVVGMVRCRECGRIVKPKAITFSSGNLECPRCTQHGRGGSNVIK